MNWITDFRNSELSGVLIDRIHRITTKPHKFMEVCGSHTVAIRKFGIASLLPKEIKLISGPGCPVCVTSRSYIDAITYLSQKTEVIITTFGDLLRIPGSYGTLENMKAEGADIRIVYSVLEALDIAIQYPKRKIIFAGIGFETTTPSIASCIIEAGVNNIRNFFVLGANKVMPPAMEIIARENSEIEGFLAPGHVSSITGSGIYQFLPANYGKAVVISGFEALDILQSLFMLVTQAENKSPKVEIQYSRAVKPEGNVKALKIMNQVFEPCDSNWRGFGIIKNSGLKIRTAYSEFDAWKLIDYPVNEVAEPTGCRCGEVLRGSVEPNDCPLFGIQCLPENPIGSCMVSNEGACQAHYKYNTYE